MPSGSVKRGGNDASVPEVRPPEGDPELLHTLQSVRDELGERVRPVGGFAHENLAAEELTGEIMICAGCEGSLKTMRGKLVCMDISCGMCGQEQRRKR